MATCCDGKDAELSGGGVRCKVLGQSGKIMIELTGNNTKGNFSEPNEDRLTFEVDAIQEVDSQGNVVGKSGPRKHALNSLASQTFTFTKADNVSYYEGIKVVNVNLTAYLSGPQANLDIMVFLFLESGNVTFGNETFSVYKGSLKFNIKIRDWEFCDAGLDNCGAGNKKETGAFIDLTLQVKSKGTPKKESKKDREKSKKKPICHKNSTCPEVYNLGGGSDVVLNNEIIIDEEIVDMSDGFPKFEVKGSKKLFTFRIPKFNNTALIDPTANVAGSEGGGEVTGGGEGEGGDTTATIPTTSEGDTSTASLPSFKLMFFGFLVSGATMFTVSFNM